MILSRRPHMSPIKSLALLIPALTLYTAGCAKQPAPLAPQAQAVPQSATVDGRPVIVRLVSRDETLTISKGPNGPVYSVHDSKGKILLASATREQLRIHHPFLSAQLDSAIATTAQPTSADNN